MKTNIIRTMAASFFLLAAIPLFAQKSDKKMATVCFDVSLTCNGCEKTVIENISFEKGVKDITANHETQRVVITYRTDKTDPEKLAEAIRELGYSARILEEGECASE